MEDQKITPTDAARLLGQRLNLGLAKARRTLLASGVQPIVFDPNSRKGKRYSVAKLNEYLESLERAA